MIFHQNTNTSHKVRVGRVIVATQGFLRAKVLLPTRWVSWRMHIWRLCNLIKLINWNTSDLLIGEFSPLVFQDMMLMSSIRAK